MIETDESLDNLMPYRIELALKSSLFFSLECQKPKLRRLKMGSYFKALLLLIVLVALVTFGIQNNETVKLHYYFGMNSMPLPVYGIVYGSILIGIFIGMLIGINSRFGQRQKIKALERENRDLKSKVPEEKPPESPEEKKQDIEVAETPADETLEVKSESED
jgi:uncharacterized integral membrane protein